MGRKENKYHLFDDKSLNDTLKEKKNAGISTGFWFGVAVVLIIIAIAMS